MNPRIMALMLVGLAGGVPVPDEPAPRMCREQHTFGPWRVTRYQMNDGSRYEASRHCTRCYEGEIRTPTIEEMQAYLQAQEDQLRALEEANARWERDRPQREAEAARAREQERVAQEARQARIADEDRKRAAKAAAALASARIDRREKQLAARRARKGRKT